MITVPEIIRYLSNLSPVVAIILIFTIKGKRSKTIKIFTAVILVSFLSDTIGFLLREYKMNTLVLIVSNCYYIIQFFLLLYFYKIQVENNTVVYIAAIAFTGFFIFNTIVFESFNTYQSWLRVGGGIIFIGFSIAYFIKIFKLNPPVHLFDFHPFWFNAGVFFYFAFSLFIILRNHVFTYMEYKVIKEYWGFHNLSNIIKNLLFTIGVVIFKDEKNKNIYKSYRSKT